MKERADSNGLYLRVLKIGKPVIPYLISVIDSENLGFVGFQDPRSSFYYGLDYNYCGIRAAYMIEYILANQINEQWMYENCVIVKKSNNKPLKKRLSYKDMKEIKKIYQKWWNDNKKKTLDELREDWKKDKDPLTNSSFMWQ
jgi:hypothetical protein